MSTNARLQDVETVYGEWGQYVNLDISALSDHLSLYELAYRFVPEKKTSNLKFYDYIPNISSGRVEIPCAIRKDLPSTTLEICALTYYHPAVGWAFGAESDRQKGR